MFVVHMVHGADCSVDSFDFVEQQRCAVEANGEPCPGTSNYLSVTYTCVKWLAGGLLQHVN